MNKYLSFLLVVIMLLICVPGWCGDTDIWSPLDVDSECFTLNSDGNLGHETGYYGFMVPLTFRSTDIAANLSAAELCVNPEAGTTELLYYYTAPYAGSVLAVSIYSDDAVTSPYLTADVTINGTVTGLQAALDTTNTQTHSATQVVGTDTFSANDRIGVKISTDSGFTPTTSDIVVLVYIAQ